MCWEVRHNGEFGNGNLRQTEKTAGHLADDCSYKHRPEYRPIVHKGGQREVTFGTMAVKVRVSYEEPQELQRVTELLQPVIKSCKANKVENGRYKRAYLDVEIPEECAQESAHSPLI